MILFLAGLQRISPSLYEAAAIDGAQGWKVLRHITLPQLRATSTAVLLLLLINAFQAFDEFYNLLSTLGASTRRTRARRSSTSTTRRSARGRTSGTAARAPSSSPSHRRRSRSPRAGSCGSATGATDMAIDPSRPRRPGGLRRPVRRPRAGCRPVPRALLPGAAQRPSCRADLTRPGLAAGSRPAPLGDLNLAELSSTTRRSRWRAACSTRGVIAVTQTVGVLVLSGLAGYGLARIPYRCPTPSSTRSPSPPCSSRPP